MTDAVWEQRQKTRQEEMEAVSKARAFLSSDEAHDLFSRTFNFLQDEVGRNSARRSQASLPLQVARRLQARAPGLRRVATPEREGG